MANLNVSLVLKADASGFKGEVRGAEAAVESLANEARGAGGAIGSALSQGVSAAQGALTRIRGVMTSVSASLRSGARQGFAQLGLQIQDIAVQAEAGVSPLRILVQQGSQIAGAFGPAGAAIGAVVAVAGGLAAAFFASRDGMTAAEAAANSFKAAMDEVGDSVGKAIIKAERLTKDFELYWGELQRLGALDFARDQEVASEALEEQAAALGKLAGELERAAAARLKLTSLGEAAIGFFGAGAMQFDPLAASLTRDQAAAIEELIAAFRQTGDEIAFVEGLQRVGAELKEVGRAALDSSIKAQQLRENIVQLGLASDAVANMSFESGVELSKLETMLKRIDAAVDTTTMSFRDLYQDVVGQSYVPDLVTEAGGWFDRLNDDMTSKTGEATSAVAEAFAGLDRQVSYRLGSMIAHNKLALADFASFAQDILGQVLGGLIGAGLNAGISGLFAPSPTFNPATATGPEVLHAGGIVGDPRNPRRGGVPWSAFLGAGRYHAGGFAGLGPNEVPVIALRGERITPAGQAAGGGVNIQIVDQRSGGAAVETRERRGANGERSIQVLIRDEVERGLARGDLDRAMAARFGARPALRVR